MFLFFVCLFVIAIACNDARLQITMFSVCIIWVMMSLDFVSPISTFDGHHFIMLKTKDVIFFFVVPKGKKSVAVKIIYELNTLFIDIHGQIEEMI